MKNGKVIRCDQVERGNGTVTIYRGEQHFSLPESAIHWEKTAAAKAELEKELARKERERAEAAANANQPKKPRWPTVELTNESYREIAKRDAPSGPITLSYRRMGNSIIVPLTLNGKGPYDIVLDTGASITVIEPRVVAEVDAKRTGQTFQMVGVASRAVDAEFVSFEEISLSGARVRDFRAASQRIDALNSRKVIGLLGQDFLNHFVMNLNSADQTVTLEPHHRGPASNQPDPQQLAHKLERFFSDLQVATQETEVLYRDFFQGASGGHASRIKSNRVRVASLQGTHTSLYGEVSQIDLGLFEEQSQANLKRFLACHPKLSQFLRELNQVAQTLSRASASKDGQNRMKNELREEANKLQTAIKSYGNCL
ncbi:retropepsin-like aspartic protease [Sulfidibacter corallicola]|uniref:Retropepsin-like domain-containing protein n=1 Tax=Sulfidibacter corallicola TaxID=2818388 RepID=A0A8A4TUN4_SULCO|nr:retropepsin-like aspartic protease [Sulfidibacter corallicola]QTD52844.1 retropepsin-like domain-containing protein [Sulfidibacter corallicola]